MSTVGGGHLNSDVTNDLRFRMSTVGGGDLNSDVTNVPRFRMFIVSNTQ